MLAAKATLDDNRPRCLVLLASYNGAEFLHNQLKSILSQQGVDTKILVSDDASIDATIQIAEAMNMDGRIQVRRRATGSGSAAQNFIRLICEADASSFDYVSLSDQDDIWMVGKLQRAATALAELNAGGYSSSVIAKWPDGSETLFCQSSKLRSADFLFEGAGQGCTFVLTREFFAVVQEFCRTKRDLTTSLVYHDWAVYAIARSLGITWIFDRQPTVWYRQHLGNDTGARGSMAGLKKRVRLILNGQYRQQVSAIANICLALNPSNAVLCRWSAINMKKSTIPRRIGKAMFCIRNGRRKPIDRSLTALAALFGRV